MIRIISLYEGTRRWRDVITQRAFHNVSSTHARYLESRVAILANFITWTSLQIQLISALIHLLAFNSRTGLHFFFIEGTLACSV